MEQNASIVMVTDLLQYWKSAFVHFMQRPVLASKYAPVTHL